MQIVIDTANFTCVRTFRRKRMVCPCHRFVLFPMARTNHTLPRNIRTQLMEKVSRGFPKQEVPTLASRWLSADMHVHALSTITGYLLRTVARYAEVHSALQPAGEAARL